MRREATNQPSGDGNDPNADETYQPSLADLGIDESAYRDLHGEHDDPNEDQTVVTDDDLDEVKQTDEDGEGSTRGTEETGSPEASDGGDGSGTDAAGQQFASVEEANAYIARLEHQFQNAQEVIGRQGNELGELRGQVKLVTEHITGQKDKESKAPRLIDMDPETFTKAVLGDMKVETDDDGKPLIKTDPAKFRERFLTAVFETAEFVADKKLRERLGDGEALADAQAYSKSKKLAKQVVEAQPGLSQHEGAIRTYLHENLEKYDGASPALLADHIAMKIQAATTAKGTTSPNATKAAGGTKPAAGSGSSTDPKAKARKEASKNGGAARPGRTAAHGEAGGKQETNPLAEIANAMEAQTVAQKLGIG